VNLLCVNDRYGFIFGNGYAVNFLEEYYGANSTTGPRRAAEIAYKAIASVLSRGDMAKRLARKFSAEVVVDGDPLPIRSFGMLIAGFVEYIGIGFKVLYRARKETGRYHLVATALSPGRITSQIHRFYSGKPLLGAHHFDLLARETVIRADEPLAYQLDGEIYRDAEIRLAAGPTVRVVVE
jgi:diacylglycerol kinase family enzyme